MDEKVVDVYLGLAWELFSSFVLSGSEPAWAIEKTEAAMRIWEEYEDRTCLFLTARATQPAPPVRVSDLLGWWITHGGQKVELKSGCGQEYPYGAIDDSPGKFAGVLYDSSGNAFSGPTRERIPDYDLEERVLRPQGGAGDGGPGRTWRYAHLGSAPHSPAAVRPPVQSPAPLDFSGRWITRGKHLVRVIFSLKGRFPYANGVGSGVPSFGMFWNSAGLAVDPETNNPAPEYDLMERAPSPGGRWMDYQPEDLKQEG